MRAHGAAGRQKAGPWGSWRPKCKAAVTAHLCLQGDALTRSLESSGSSARRRPGPPSLEALRPHLWGAPVPSGWPFSKAKADLHPAFACPRARAGPCRLGPRRFDIPGGRRLRSGEVLRPNGAQTAKSCLEKTPVELSARLPTYPRGTEPPPARTFLLPPEGTRAAQAESEAEKSARSGAPPVLGARMPCSATKGWRPNLARAPGGCARGPPCPCFPVAQSGDRDRGGEGRETSPGLPAWVLPRPRPCAAPGSEEGAGTGLRVRGLGKEN